MQDEENKTADTATPDTASDQTPASDNAPSVPRPLPEHVNEALTGEGNTYLHELCRKKASPALIAEAIEVLGAEPDMPNSAGLPALAYAIAEADSETVECLRRLGASIVTGRFNAILYAVDANKPDALNVLLRTGRGAGVNEGGMLLNKEITTDTPLLAVLAAPRDEMIMPLIDAGALIEMRRQKDGATALHLAASRRSAVPATLLLQAGADPTLKNGEGQTPLHLAAADGRVEVLQAMIDHGVDVDTPDRDGHTALHTAVIKKQLESVQVLLAAGARVDVRMADMYDETPLMAAARRGYDEIALELLAAGADALAQNSSKQTAADLVNQQSSRELYDFMKAEESFRLRDQFEKAHRRLVDQQRFVGPKAPPRFGR